MFFASCRVSLCYNIIMMPELSRQKSRPLKHYYTDALIREWGEINTQTIVSKIQSLSTITSVETIRKRVPFLMTKKGYERMNTTKVVLDVWTNVVAKEAPHEKYIKVFMKDMQMIETYHHYPILMSLNKEWLQAVKEWHPYQGLIQVILSKSQKTLMKTPELYVSNFKDIVPIYKCLKFFGLSYEDTPESDVYIKGNYKSYLLGVENAEQKTWETGNLVNNIETMLWFDIAHQLKKVDIMQKIVDSWLQNISVAHRGTDYVLSPFDAFIMMSDIDVKEMKAWYAKYDFFQFIQHLPLSAQNIFTEVHARAELYHVLNSLEMTSIDINHYFHADDAIVETPLHF